jgi:hypothetical protein
MAKDVIKQFYMKRIYCSILFVLVLIFQAHAQENTVPILERTISINATDEKITSLLNRIGHEGGFSFSYNSAIISSDETVSINADNRLVREILNEVFQGAMNYKQKSNYLILTKAAPPVVKNNTIVFNINGYVADLETGEKIPQASVYEKNSVVSAVTDEYGYFKLRLEKKSTDSLSLSISKKNYYDTLVRIISSTNQYVNIFIQPIKIDTLPIIDIELDSIPVPKKEEIVFPYESEPNIQNIHDTLHRLVQVSFLPFLGTNDRLSGNVINDYSINFLAGYSMGTRQIELGFFLNMDRTDVSWLQIAGFGNMVGRNVFGIQAAGFFNLNGGETNAIQLAGFANTNLRNVHGVQLAGFANTNLGPTRGVQIAGFSNLSIGSSEGVQVAGFDNVQIENYRGSQIAGFTNITTGKISGSQISSFFNYGKNVKGTQIGLFNYADSLGGIPIGLVSIVKSGYHKIELSADEIFYGNLSFRTGARKFYTILQAGFKPDKSLNASDTSVWHFGYGLGTARQITKWLYLNIDASAQHVSKGSFTNSLSLLNKIHLGFDFQVAKNFSLYAGATLNGYLTNNSYTDYPNLFTDYKPHIISDQTIGNNNLKMWWGAKVALRFL